MQEVNVIPTGSTLLDCVLNGGYPLGQIVNIAGLKSTGKTLLAIEAAANFSKEYDGRIRYLDAESAFKPDYAAAIGFPIDKAEMVTRPDESKPFTVELWFEDIKQFIEESNGSGLYIVDSLDALSYNAEADAKKLEKQGYGTGKSTLMSQFFRNVVAPLQTANVCLFIVRQFRENVSGYGPKYKTSGGVSNDYYANQQIDLKKSENIEKTVEKDSAVIGIQIGVNCPKNKIGKAHRECEFPILFDYGIDDLSSCLYFLEERKALEEVPGLMDITKQAKKISTMIGHIENLSEDEFAITISNIQKTTTDVWNRIQSKFEPNRRRKY